MAKGITEQKVITLTGLRPTNQETVVEPQVVQYQPAPRCKRLTKHGKCVGRPSGSSPDNVNYRTKKGKRPKELKVASCPVDSRTWVDVTTGGGKKGKRCRCTAPGNRRYLENSKCK